MTSSEVYVLDHIEELYGVLEAGPSPLAWQELWELERIETIRQLHDLDTQYVVALGAGAVRGLVPVYPTPSWYLPPSRITGLFTTAVPSWSRAVLIGSDTMGPSVLHTTQGDSTGFVRAALAVAAIHNPDLTCFPLLDDAQHALVSAAAAGAWTLTGSRVEAYLDLPFASFEDYIMALPRQRRVQVRRERRAFLASDLTVSWIPPADAAELEPLVSQVERKYGSPTSPEVERAYLESTAIAMGDQGKALVVHDGPRPIGMVILWDVGSHWRIRCWGCDYRSPAVRDAYVYFNLMFYEPIAYLLKFGSTRLVLGTGSLQAKCRRGAHTRRLTSIGSVR